MEDGFLEVGVVGVAGVADGEDAWLVEEGVLPDFLAELEGEVGEEVEFLEGVGGGGSGELDDLHDVDD